MEDGSWVGRWVAVVEGLGEESFAVCWIIVGKRYSGVVYFLIMDQDTVRTVLITCFEVLC